MKRQPNVVLRILLTLVSGVAVFYFVFWMGTPLTLFDPSSPQQSLWIGVLASSLVAAGVAWYVWAHTASLPGSLASSVLLGAFIMGGVGFSAGFFGPLLFPPRASANVGPALGLFLTGPAGFFLGAIGGAIYWAVRRVGTPSNDGLR